MIAQPDSPLQPEDCSHVIDAKYCIKSTALNGYSYILNFMFKYTASIVCAFSFCFIICTNLVSSLSFHLSIFLCWCCCLSISFVNLDRNFKHLHFGILFLCLFVNVLQFISIVVYAVHVIYQYVVNLITFHCEVKVCRFCFIVDLDF